jgi:hypothetical protein
MKQDELLADAVAALEKYQVSDPNSELRKTYGPEIVRRRSKDFGLGDDFPCQFDAWQRAAESRMFSRHDNPAWCAIVFELVKKIEPIMEKGHWSDNRKVVFGTSATGKINGFAIPIENPEYHAILLEDGLFGYSDLLAKGLAHMFPVKQPRENLTYVEELARVEQNIRQHPILVRRLVDLVLTYVIEGHPYAAEQYSAGESYVGLSLAWFQTFVTFILAHEFGHVRLGHLTKPPGTSAERRQREFDADRFGLAITLAAFPQLERLAYSGAGAIFLGFDLLFRAFASFYDHEYDDTGSETHPA